MVLWPTILDVIGSPLTEHTRTDMSATGWEHTFLISFSWHSHQQHQPRHTFLRSICSGCPQKCWLLFDTNVDCIERNTKVKVKNPVGEWSGFRLHTLSTRSSLVSQGKEKEVRWKWIWIKEASAYLILPLVPFCDFCGWSSRHSSVRGLEKKTHKTDLYCCAIFPNTGESAQANFQQYRSGLI